MNALLKTLLLSLILFAFTTCKKQVRETVAVIEFEDISIPENIDVKHFSFPTLNTGYVAGKSLYKTSDGGKNWLKLSLTGNIAGVEFFDEQKGICIMNGLAYKTFDGGLTWDSDNSASSVDIAQDGRIVLLEYGSQTFKFRISSDTGKTFKYMADE